jgi:hypothetical protein
MMCSSARSAINGAGVNSNALAVSYPYFRDRGSDGTVMLGVNLVKHLRPSEWRRSLDEGLLKLAPGGSWIFADFTIFVVIAHECGHILQFKERVDESWEMEPHADFMAGWAIGKFRRDVERNEAIPKSTPWWNNENIEAAVNTLFSFGGTSFNDSTHHGEPQLRAVMVRAGYDAADLGLKEAFEKGRMGTGLKRG